MYLKHPEKLPAECYCIKGIKGTSRYRVERSRWEGDDWEPVFIAQSYRDAERYCQKYSDWGE